MVRGIICRYGLPQKIVLDNRLQFDSDLFTEFSQSHGIIKSFSSVAHPQDNVQVEAVNKMLRSNLKKRLQHAKRALPEELPNVLWSYTTMIRTTTGHSPFSMAYGFEVMIPVEETILTHQRDTYNPTTNHTLLQELLVLIEELRENSQLWVAAYQQKVAKYFNVRVKDRKFSVGDLVLRRVF